ncbi:unnamed protein product [Peniophora sp. CBMAI 1063]|nr:unnamed protein product [Peniophora sp. CBMAI 1063]
MNKSSTDSWLNEPIYAKWIHWHIFGRLLDLSQTIDLKYKPGDEWDINEERFCEGMAIEAAWMCRITGWAAVRSIPLNSRLFAAYARVVAASAGKCSIDDSLFNNKEMWHICNELKIVDEEDGPGLEDMDADFNKIMKRPPPWWLYLSPDPAVRADGRAHARDAERREAHLQYVHGLDVAHRGPDFGEAEREPTRRRLMKTLDDAEHFLRRLEKDQDLTYKKLGEEQANNTRELLAVFQAAYPHAQLNFREQHILDSAEYAEGAGPAGGAGASRN